MAYLPCDDARIYYEDRGAGDPACVLIHGWCGDHSSMEPLAADLGSRHRVLNMDLRGHGESAALTGAYSMDGMAADAVAVADLARGPAVLVGHSMGGRVALAAAAMRPASVRALVILDSALVEERGYVGRRRAELDGPDWSSQLRRRLELLVPYGAPTEGAVERMLRTPLDAVRGTLDASDGFDAAKALRALQPPLLYIGASHPRHDPATVWSLSPDASYGQVVGAGHFVQFDARAQVSAMIDRFLQLVLAT